MCFATMSMSEPDSGFVAALQPLAEALGRELGLGVLRVEVDAASARVRLDRGVLRVPARFEHHWRSFGALPTDLVRDLASVAHDAAPGSGDEADRVVFVEAFVRDHVLNAG